MLVSNIIGKNKISSMLDFLIVSREDLLFFGDLLENINKSVQEKIIYLLYNEYISLHELESDSEGSGNTENTHAENVKNAVNAVLEEFDTDTYSIFNTIYGNIKSKFIRDNICTLSYKNYQKEYDLNGTKYDNILDQMKVVVENFNDEEKTFLKTFFVISDDANIDDNIAKCLKDNFIRIETNNEIKKSGIEKSTDYLSRLSLILNGRNSDTETYKSSVLESIFNKIRLGTINY